MKELLKELFFMALGIANLMNGTITVIALLWSAAVPYHGHFTLFHLIAIPVAIFSSAGATNIVLLKGGR